MDEATKLWAVADLMNSFTPGCNIETAELRPAA
jgi:hypothetical protein